MRHMYTKIAVLVVILVLGCTQLTWADRVVVELRGSDVTTVSPDDSTLGKYYTIRIDLPAGLKAKAFHRAFLKLTVDVDARNQDDFRNPAPVLEVYALTERFGGALDVGTLRKPSPMKRSVRRGLNQKVRVDITPAIEHFLSNPNENHGLVVGSLTKGRDGLFTLSRTGNANPTVVYHSLPR